MKLLYIPIPSEEEAIKLAKALLTEGLIACANVYKFATIEKSKVCKNLTKSTFL